MAGFSEELPVGDDHDLLLRLAVRGPYAMIRHRTAVIQHTRGSRMERGRALGAYLPAYEAIAREPSRPCRRQTAPTAVPSRRWLKAACATRPLCVRSPNMTRRRLPRTSPTRAGCYRGSRGACRRGEADEACYQRPRRVCPRPGSDRGALARSDGGHRALPAPEGSVCRAAWRPALDPHYACSAPSPPVLQFVLSATSSYGARSGACHDTSTDSSRARPTCAWRVTTMPLRWTAPNRGTGEALAGLAARLRQLRATAQQVRGWERRSRAQRATDRHGR